MSKFASRAALLSGASAAILAAVAASPSFAQSGEAVSRDKIVVTARKREETLQDVPFSLNAQTEEAIRNSGATDLETLAQNVAGFYVMNLEPGQTQPTVRGVSAGQIVRDQPGVKEQVGVYLDESVISLSLFTPDLDLFDLNRVEVLRGPQGTLFGSGSLAGTLRYITNQPDLTQQSFLGEASGGYIDDGEFGGHIKGMANIPLVEGKLGLRAVASYTRFAGYIDAVQPDLTVDDDVNGGDRWGGRIALGYEPNASLKITPRVAYSRIDMDGFNREDRFNILANPFTTTEPAVTLGERQQFRQLTEKFEDEFLLADLTAEWDAGPVTVTSITSYTDRDILVRRDATALTGSITFDFGLSDDAVRLDAALDDETEVEVWTQELRVSSNSEGPLQWVLGVFYSDIDRHYGQTLNVPGWDQAYVDAGNDPADLIGNFDVAPADSPFFSRIPYEFTQLAFFGEASVALTDQLTFTVGGRYFDFEEDRTLTFDGIFAAETIGVPGNTQSEGFVPRVLASYQVNENLQLNAQYSEGFRLGGINDPLNTPLCSAQDLITFGGRDSFEDERSQNFELGAKSTLWGGKATLNAAVFHAELSDLQATLDAGTCSSRIIFNVPEAHSTGAEFEFAATPNDSFDFSVAASYTDAELDSTVTSTPSGGGTPVVVGGIEKGNRLPTAPRFQAAASGTFTQPVWGHQGFLTGTVQHVGSRFTQFGDLADGFGTFTIREFGGVAPGTTVTIDPKLPGYEVVNLRAGLRSDTWEVAGFINNVFDEEALLSLDRERGGVARLGFRTNQPRTFGVTLRSEF